MKEFAWGPTCSEQLVLYADDVNFFGQEKNFKNDRLSENTAMSGHEWCAKKENKVELIVQPPAGRVYRSALTL